MSKNITFNPDFMQCGCRGWARIQRLDRITNHHERCPHYNDSLIDVWKISDGHLYYYTDNANDIYEEGAGLIVTKEKIHKEIFENLPEFNGF